MTPCFGAFIGIRQLVSDAIADMEAEGDGEPIPTAFADRKYSGEFKVRIPPELHRALVVTAAEERISLNRLVSLKLSAIRARASQFPAVDTADLLNDLESERK